MPPARPPLPPALGSRTCTNQRPRSSVAHSACSGCCPRTRSNGISSTTGADSSVTTARSAAASRANSASWKRANVASTASAAPASRAHAARRASMPMAREFRGAMAGCSAVRARGLTVYLGVMGALRITLPLLPLLACAAGAHAQEPKFRRVVVDAAFRSEGIAVADVNRDGRADLLVGDIWYEAPDWKPHRIRKGKDYGDGAHNWSDCFCCFSQDLDGDGFPDEIVVGFPGSAGHWYRNPGKDGGEWQGYEFAPSICNESPQWVDLLGDGRKGLLCGRQPEGGIVWLSPGKDPTQPWPALVIAGPHAP